MVPLTASPTFERHAARRGRRPIAARVPGTSLPARRAVTRIVAAIVLVLGPSFTVTACAKQPAVAGGAAAPAAATANSLAGALPASTPVFVEWTTPKAPSRTSAIAQTCEEPEMQKFFKELAKLSPEFPAWMFDPDKLPTGVDAKSGCFALRSFARARSSYPEMLWQFQSDEPEGMLDFMRNILDVSFAAVKAQSQGTIDFVVVELDEPRPQGPTARFTIEVVYRVIDDRLFLSTSEGFLREVIRQREKGALANGLLESETYRRVNAALGQRSFVRGFINVEGILATLPRTASASIHATGFDGLRAIGFGVDAQDGGLRERYYFDAPAPRRGMLQTWSLTASAKHATTYAAPESILFSNLHYDIGTVYRSMLTMYRTLQPAALRSYEAKLAAFEARTGVSLEKDLLPAATGEIAVSARLGGFGFAPDVLCAIGIDRKKDPKIADKIDRVVEAIPNLSTRAADLGDGRRIVHAVISSKPSASDGSGNETVRRQRTAVGGFLWSFLQPHYCVTDDYVLIGFTPQSVRSALTRRASGKNLATSSAFRKSIATVNGESKRTGSILYIDLARLIEFAYNASIPYLQSTMQNLPENKRFDVTAIPSVETLTKHVFPMVAVMSSDDSGITMESHSPIGSGMLAAFSSSLATSLLTKPIPMGSATPPAPVARVKGASYEEARNLGNLARFEGRYREAAQHYEAALSALRDTAHRKQDRAQLNFYLGLVYRELTEYDAARKSLGEARDLGYFPGNCEYFLATIAAREGEEQRAIEHLQKAVAAGWDRYENLARDRDFDRLRDKAAFRSFIARLQERDRGR